MMKTRQICFFDDNYLKSEELWLFGYTLHLFMKMPLVTPMYMCIVLQVNNNHATYLFKGS